MTIAPGKGARNEQRKITATAVNNVAVAMVVTGVVVPVVNFVRGISPSEIPGLVAPIALGLICLC